MAKITEIHVYSCDLPVKGPPYRMATSALTTLQTTLVEVVTDTGHVGYGETCPLGPTYQPAHIGGARAALQVLAPPLLGYDPVLVGIAGAVMDAQLSGHGYAKAALDIALWDLAGRILGRRVCDLLGGAHVTRVPSYYAIGIAEPDEVARIVHEKQAEGFRRLQIKVGGRDVAEDIAVARMACEVARPGLRLVLDANRSLTMRDAMLLSQGCAGLPLVLEQFCDSYAEIAALKGRLRHPVYLDESATDIAVVAGAIADGVADGFGMKLTRVGGITPMRAIRDLCAATRRPITCDDAWGGDIIAAACVHMGASVVPDLFDGTWIAAPYIEGHYDPAGGIAVTGGAIDVPNGPGLGVCPDKAGWQAVASFG